MQVHQVPVLFNRQETPHVWRLGLALDAWDEPVRPGQFAMLSWPDWREHILPRPFSFSDCRRDERGRGLAEFLYKPIGRVTRSFTRLEAGDVLCLGAVLGNGFPAPAAARRPVLLAGGIGNAPFALLVRSLLAGGTAPQQIMLLLAGRGRDDIWIQDFVREAGICLVEVTEDGSLGERGRVTDALLLRLPDLGPSELFACGPPAMLRAVQGLALAHSLPCHLALEEFMACGYGVCNACVIERREGDHGSGTFLKLCLDGPVCEAREVFF